ncbi:MAG: DUF624 domain-containing protein [Ruminococcus sp.]|nr:DUF624 domain-containing protein [Ruminococcus sp.]
MFSKFSNDFESRGSGIAKNAPKKKGLMLFFEIFIRKFWKLLQVNMLYTVFFIPLLIILVAISFIYENMPVALTLCGIMLVLFVATIGPATAGMTKVMRNYVLEKHSFIVHDFFRAFKANFKKASLIGFIDCFIMLSVYASFVVYPILAKQSGTKLMYIPMVITLSLAIVVMMMNYYIYLMLIATNLSFKNLVKNSFALAFVAMKNNIITFAVNAVVIVGMALLYIYMRYLFFMLIPFVPSAFLCFVTCFNSYPVIQKYVINPYYASMGKINPELVNETPSDDISEEVICEDMGGKEKPIGKRKKTKGRRIS